jgi:hypothetical protein
LGGRNGFRQQFAQNLDIVSILPDTDAWAHQANIDTCDVINVNGHRPMLFEINRVN